MTFKLLDLFSGIGGFSLGLEATGGFRTVAFCEIEPYCRRVLAKHWPGVPIHGDIRSLAAGDLAGLGVDAICGGFPCQDISSAGSRGGIDGSRSGLWSEYARLIGELRPRVAIVENVAALLGRGIGRVLGDLAALGYDAEWHCIGAPHRRDRVWIVAHPSRDALWLKQQRMPGRWAPRVCDEGEAEPRHDGASEPVADADGRRPQGAEPAGSPATMRRRLADADSAPMADANGRRCEDEREPQPAGQQGAPWCEPDRRRQPDAMGDASEPGLSLSQQHRWRVAVEEAADKWGPATESGWWAAEPGVGRMAHGVPARVDRLRGLGNAVVPQVVEAVGRVVMEMGL